MDITMCCAKNCTYANKCYRYRATPNEYNQYYCDFSYECNVGDGFSYFINMLETKIIRKDKDGN